MRARRYRPVVLTGLTLLLNACTTLFPESCEQFEAQRKHTNYATDYRLDSERLGNDVKPLAKDEMAAARFYQMTLDTERARVCSHVQIRKELLLVRRDNAGMIFEETREFFTEDGARIATKVETLSTQLTRSGRYSAAVPLPIPQNAPPGKYRLISTLTLRFKGSAKPVLLGKTSATFQVATASGDQSKKR